MPYNPSPLVAVARDAAARLDADRAVIVFTRKDGTFGYASYGETRALCASARRLGDALYEAAERHFVDGPRKQEQEP